MTAASLRSRNLNKAKPKIKARERKGLRLWAIVSFAIESGLRRGEMLALQWQHLHHTPDGAYLLLPAAITKTKTERVVPLSLRAERILKTQPKVGESIFNSNYEAGRIQIRSATPVDSMNEGGVLRTVDQQLSVNSQR